MCERSCCRLALALTGSLICSVPAWAGQLVGISDVGQGYGLDIRSYVIGSYRDVFSSSVAATYTGDAGLDFFYSLTPQVKANLTINTDFAQTEVDDRQVNLTRFPLFFPEKRGFFLDGADNFDFSREPSDAISGFFSRRIGLDANGQPQAIDYGAKVSGQMGASISAFCRSAPEKSAGYSARTSRSSVRSASCSRNPTWASCTRAAPRAARTSRIGTVSAATSSLRPAGFEDRTTCS